MSEGKPIWLHLDSIGVSILTPFRSFVGVLPPLQASDSRAFSEAPGPFGRTKARPYVALRQIRVIRVL
ncbi:MAG: hypothetical protein ACI31B_00615 [Muribaculaceae bacterium]